VELAAPAAINTLKLTPGPHPVVVAVIDSGVIAEHPSLSDRVLPGYDMQSVPANLRGQRSSNFAPDPLGTRCPERASSNAYRTHGTEVSSLIAGNGHDEVRGVNPQAKIVPIRVIGACGMARRDLIDAIRWAAGLPVEGVPENLNPAQVINISLAGGTGTCHPELQQVISQIVAKGIIIVAAAGNNFHRFLQEPANCQGVLSVGAVDAKNRLEVYSAMDPRTQIYAPGGGKALDSNLPWGINKLRVATYDLDFLGRERANALDRGVGTSYAAPVVAGFIALWLSHQPQLSLEVVLRDLPQYLREVEPIDKCNRCRPHGLAAHAGFMKP
jgi:serine protease